VVVEEVEDLVPEVDRDFLEEKGHKFTAKRVGADVHVVIEGFPFPEAYAPRAADLLIVLPAGYPNANLDMFRTLPDVKLINGSWPRNADNREVHDGVSWQRWSRHFTSAWRQGVDNLRTFVTSIKRELDKGI
jgi:E2/UBC family protein E